MCRTWSDAKTASIGYTTSMVVKEIRVPSRGMLQTDVHMVKERVSDEVDNSICHMWNLDRYDSDV